MVNFIDEETPLSAENLNKLQRDLQEQLDNQIETFQISLDTGRAFDTTRQNQGYYNNITKQVTLVFYITGCPNDWAVLGTIDSKYAPPKDIFIETTSGGARSQINIISDGTIRSWKEEGFVGDSIRGIATYYTI